MYSQNRSTFHREVARVRGKAQEPDRAFKEGEPFEEPREIERLDTTEELGSDARPIESATAGVRRENEPLLRSFPQELDVLRETRTGADDESRNSAKRSVQMQRARSLGEKRGVVADIRDPSAPPRAERRVVHDVLLE